MSLSTLAGVLWGNGYSEQTMSTWELIFNLCMWIACIFSCDWLCDPLRCRPPASSVHGIFQVRILEWIAIPFSRHLPDPAMEPRDLPHWQADAYHWATWEAPCEVASWFIPSFPQNWKDTLGVLLASYSLIFIPQSSKNVYNSTCLWGSWYKTI